MLADLADAHLREQLGLTDVSPQQCSPFMPCEYNMREISEPLKTPFGSLDIKRIAFDRIVHLTAEQSAAMKAGGKLETLERFSKSELQALVESGGCSFPHQLGDVYMALDMFPKLPTKVVWA